MRAPHELGSCFAAPGGLVGACWYSDHILPPFNSWDAVEALTKAAGEVFDGPPPLTANTLVGVSALWLPDLLVEIEAIAVL